MGVFINVNGDPVRGTLQWPCNPLSICLDYPYVTTLLPDQAVQVHDKPGGREEEQLEVVVEPYDL